MKLFQQLLVAPAALGLVAPLAANASDLNIDGVSEYSGATEQVTSINNFNDVQPTDWTHQELSKLAKRYNCVEGLKGNQVLSRFEAASILNSCLERVTEVTDEVSRLTSEFSTELATIQGRMDGLLARVGELDATQFSTTTKLSGKATMVLGATGYDMDGQKDVIPDGQRTDGTTLTYAYQLNLNTSFTGEDLLYTRVKTGNDSTSAFGGKDAYVTPAYLEHANSNQDTLKVDKLWYQFPVTNGFTAYVGPKIENYYMLERSPSIYKPLLKAFKLGGNYGTYGASTGAGFGVSWQELKDDPMTPGVGFSTGYTAEDGKVGKPSSGGMFTADADSIWLTQVSYGNPQWQVSFAYASKGDEATQGFGTELGGASNVDCTTGSCESSSDSFAIRGFWQPEENGLVPSFSAGFDWTNYSLPGDAAKGTREASAGWFLGMSWKDAFIDGNRLGLAIGGLQWATERKNSNGFDGTDTEGEENVAMELYYDIKVSDNITVTPAVFYLSNPFGAETGDTQNSDLGASTGGHDADHFAVWGGLVKTTFKF